MCKIAELEEEVRRQTELKVAYKCQLDRMQDYLMHCLEIARDNGFLDRVSAIDQQNYSLSPEIRPRVSATVNDPHLAAITCQAIHNGWSIEPHEVWKCLKFFSLRTNRYVHAEIPENLRMNS